MIVVVMGVAGSGKTTVGQQLAANLGWRFVEGDDFHPAANVAKMAQGQPLTDADRAPWLQALRREMVRSRDRGESLVVTCSALKASYRAMLRGDDGAAVQFVYLKVDPAVLQRGSSSGRATLCLHRCWPVNWQRWRNQRTRSWWVTTAGGAGWKRSAIIFLRSQALFSMNTMLGGELY
jgi:carbohydrate kinase (thermoresistant glucokinase family)